MFKQLLQSLRSASSLTLVLVWMAVIGFPWLYFYILPAAWIWPHRRPALVSSYMRGISRGIFALLTLGGARYRRSGALPTDGPILVVMNHQSLLDITTITLMAQPYVPAFVTRARYARFVPLVSPCVRLLGCPIIDPRRRLGAIAALREAAPALDHGLLIFCEEHRTRDGEMGRFKAGGVQAILEARRMPVWLVVTDGFWQGRRLVDFVLNADKVDGRTEVIGRLDPPEDAREIPGFVEELRARIAARLREMRGGDARV